jgi:H+/Cl- antiporter ClcA
MLKKQLVYSCRLDKLQEILSVLGTVLVIKIFLTISTFGILLPAGIFTPSMAVGALAGRMLGIATLELQRQVETWNISCQALLCINVGESVTSIEHIPLIGFLHNVKMVRSVLLRVCMRWLEQQQL